MPEPSLLRDFEYLRQVQYRDSSRLADRAGLHAKYSTSTVSWYDFVVEHCCLRPGSWVLEMGCGPGWLWQRTVSSLPDDVHLVLTDLSPGMVEEAVARCSARRGFASVEGLSADGRHLPFETERFDLVVANHMLYHVPRPEDAVREAGRVVKRAGRFVAATNGRSHLLQVRRLREEVFGVDSETANAAHFGADSGFGVLRRHFTEVSWSQFEDELICTDPADVLAYLCSTPPADAATESELETLRSAVERDFERGGGRLQITKDVGLFVCEKPLGALA